MEVFLQLLVLLQGENDRDPERELIDNVTGSALNVANLLTSLWCAGTINLRSLRRVGRVLNPNMDSGCRPGEVIYAGVPLDDIRDGIVSINPSIWRLRSSWARSLGARPPDSRGAQGLLLLRGRFDQQSL